jgi:hypothetical protein
MSLESTVGIAKIGTKSLRATIPEGIVAFLELTEGDKLDWKMETQSDERVVIVRKARAHEDGAFKAKPASSTATRLIAKHSKSK